MTAKEQAMVAEKIDKFQKTIALGLFVLAVTYVLELARMLTTGETSEVLDKLSLGGGILVILIILPAFIRYMMLKAKYRKLCLEPEGFIIETFKRASVVAWSATFLFMVALNAFLVYQGKLEPNPFAGWTPEFYLKAIMAVTLGVHSVFFFFQTRKSSEEENFEGDDA